MTAPSTDALRPSDDELERCRMTAARARASRAARPAGTLHAVARAPGNDPRIGLRLPDLARAAGLDVVEYRGWTAAGPTPLGMRGPAWAARHEQVRAGRAGPGDVTRWDAAFAARDTAPGRPPDRPGLVPRRLPQPRLIRGDPP